MFLLSCIFFRSAKYYLRYNLSILTQLFIIASRGVIGGYLLYALLNFINSDMQWQMVIHSTWFYIIMFLLGYCFAHLFVWSFIILLPLEALGWLKPIISWFEDMIIIILVIGFYLLSMIADIFKGGSIETG